MLCVHVRDVPDARQPRGFPTKQNNRYRLEHAIYTNGEEFLGLDDESVATT